MADVVQTRIIDLRHLAASLVLHLLYGVARLYLWCIPDPVRVIITVQEIQPPPPPEDARVEWLEACYRESPPSPESDTRMG